MTAVAAWVAPIATMLAAMITAANLGARVTGWGFVIFAVGSVAWSAVALSTGQGNLLWTNVLLTIVNAVGIWRWLGRQARYEEGGKAAAAKSRSAASASVIALESLAGRPIIGRDGEQIGVTIEGMMTCSDARIAYWIVSEGGVGGIGERLHAIDPDELSITEEQLTSPLSRADLSARRVIPPSNWPASLRAA